MMSWPILSVTTFLPLVGALFIMLMRGEDEAVKRNARWVALWTTLITLAVSLLLACAGRACRRALGRVPFRRKQAVARRHHQVPHGGRRHLAAVRDPDHGA